MNYAKINKIDIANGTGVRVSLFVSGCTHHCKGCFNKEAWDFNYGYPFTVSTLKEIMTALEPSHIQGLTLLGGEPFEPENQRILVNVLRTVRQNYPKKDVWCYTGYTYEELLSGKCRAKCEVTDEMLSMIDVLVDGEFVEELHKPNLKFRGSSNQRFWRNQNGEFRLFEM